MRAHNLPTDLISIEETPLSVNGEGAAQGNIRLQGMGVFFLPLPLVIQYHDKRIVVAIVVGNSSNYLHTHAVVKPYGTIVL